MMDSSGFSLPRPDCFPAGLRVLVVDDDPTWLKILEKMLKKCNYEVSVTTCNLAREALDLLRERKGGYDIVISDVNMPDMDGFKLLEHVGLKMDLPVIMMSVDGETSRVMKGVQHGVCDYLLKPIRMKELRNIWQHVFRKRIQEVRDIEGHEEIQMMRDDGYFFCAGVVPGNKRKELDNRNDGDPSSSKKARVVWTVDLHQKFVNAVNLIGLEKVGPKKILDLMGVPWLTRENVASHLQKYRLYLSRLQKENDTKASLVGSKQSEFSPKENVHSKVPVPGDDSKIFEGNIKNEMNDLAKSSSSSISFDSHPFGPLNSDAVFKHEKKPAFCVEKKFDHLPLPIEVDSGKPMHGGIVPWHSTSTRSQHSEKVMKVESTAALFSIQPESHLTSQHTVDQVPCSIWREKSQSLEQNDPGSGHRNTLIGTGSALWDTYFSEYSPQTDVHIQNPYLGTVDPLSFNNQDFITDVPSYLYDALKFNREFHVEPVEYPVVGQGVYIS